MSINDSKKIVLLSGGTGTPKLILGLRNIIPDRNLTIIGNTGDDDQFYGLLVSPDVDTLLYLFSNMLDIQKFWGVKDETFNSLAQLEHMKEVNWFNLGDKDLALHLLRNKLMISGMTLTETIAEICRRLNIEAEILPMSNDQIRTVMIDKEGTRYSFQVYTVKLKEKPEIVEVEYVGAKDTTITAEVENALNSTSTIIIGPSNPITSIGPMLAISKLRETLMSSKATIIAVSPFEGNEAFSGPAARLMTTLNFEASSYGLAELYRDFLDIIIISDKDKELIPKIKELDIEPICMDISLRTPQERKKFGEKLIKLLEEKER